MEHGERTIVFFFLKTTKEIKEGNKWEQCCFKQLNMANFSVHIIVSVRKEKLMRGNNGIKRVEI